MSTATDNPARLKARVTVATGPDRGQSLAVTEELVHIGRGAENHLALTDPHVAEHQISIVFRGGRYAIYTPIEGSTEVDGSVIPHARWVWLPATARIRVSDKTSLYFSESNESAGASASPAAGKAPRAPHDASADSVNVEGGAKKEGKPAKKKAKKETAVAKFITDRGGEALVKLGDDGHLPELNLTEGAERAAQRDKPKETNPLLVYGLVGFSFLMSITLLLLDDEGGSVSSEARAQAQIDIRKFYGEDAAPGEKPKSIEKWQQWLRDARLAASRRDREAERRAYRKVLNQLNSEDNKGFTGLTGSRDRDEELRRLIATLMHN